MAGEDFTPVSETLFLPLYALALESQRPDPITVDEGAVALTRRLNEFFADSDKPMFRRLARGQLPSALLVSMSLRIREYDRYVRAFLAREPNAVVVNLGCGLDDRRRRVDNGRLRWYDLDLPEVIAFRRRFLGENERMHFLPSSVLDFVWMEALPAEPGRRFLFVAEGLLMYLPPEAVRALVIRLCRTYPGAELVAEVASRWTVSVFHSRYGRGKFRRNFGLTEDVVYEFGMDDRREMETWSPGLEFLDAWTYFQEDEPKLGWMRVFGKLPRLRWMQYTVHYRFRM